MAKQIHKYQDGSELLVGLNIYGNWCVSFWDKDLKIQWRKIFKTEAEAILEFERLSNG